MNRSSEKHEYGERNVGGDAALTWLGVLGAVAICFAIFAAANYFATAKTPPDFERIKQRKELLDAVTGKGRLLISEPGKNADGTFRIPVSEAEKILLGGTAGEKFGLVQETARKEKPDTKN